MCEIEWTCPGGHACTSSQWFYCAAGYECTAGSPNTTAAPCAPGQYSTGGAAVCPPCPGGAFGDAAALRTPACSGNCTAGYMCPPGSTSPTQVSCPAGTYSLPGAASCTQCAAGRYGDASTTADPECTAPCRPGSYGATPGQTSPTCSGNCTAGYVCPAGSTTPTAVMCGVGQYSTAGSGTCVNCPGGRYGDSMGLATPMCSGPCAVGYVCPPGSNTSTPVPSCPAGRYGDAATGLCVDCPAGRFGMFAEATSLSACSACAAGFYGNTSGLTGALCSGICSAGYYCQGRKLQVVSTVHCPQAGCTMTRALAPC
jgi:hypothetical protein